MWIWVVLVIAAVCAVGTWLVRQRGEPDNDLEAFFENIAYQIRRSGPEYGVRGIVPGTMTMVVSVHGQEVPVPMENVFRHFMMFPGQTDTLVRQLLDEIEEVGLERPSDRLFAETATQVLPQICSFAWVFDNAPAFGDGAMVHRDLGPDLAICYVIDDPWSVVFVCNAHLRQWGRSEADLYHLAHQNLRRKIGGRVPLPDGGPVHVRVGDGYEAARVVLLDPESAEDLLIAMPSRESLFLGRERDVGRLVALMESESDEAARDHPLSNEVYRLEGQQLVPITAPVHE